MPAVEEVTDPTDWLTTPLSTFAPLDAALRCQVCKDFYNTPMMTSCSHTFCSLCIRRCLSTDGQCPTCRQSDQPSKLRRNWTVQELVDAFATARTQGLELARKAGQESQPHGEPRRKRRKLEGRDSNTVSTRQTRQTRNSARRTNGAAPSQDSMVLDSEDENVEEYQPSPTPEPEEPKDGLVACPMCQKRMKEEAVFAHLDRCDADNDSSAPVSKQRKPKTPPLKPPSVMNLANSPAKHLPHLNYNLLRDNALKKKLQELGIPAWGPRQLLIRRHTQWVDIVNANSDSPRPRSNRDLLKDLDTWERTQGGNAPGQGQTGPTGVMKKDFDGEEWTGRHKTQFDDLIASARAKVKAKAEESKAVEQQPPITEDRPPGEVSRLPPPSTARSEMEQLKAEQQAIAAQTIHMETSSLNGNSPISGAQMFLQNAASDIPMRDPSPPTSPDYNPPPSSQNKPPTSSQAERHTAHPDRRYSNPNTNTTPHHSSSPQQNHTPSGSLPASLSKERSIGENMASPGNVRRIPMFRVPEESVRDNERFGAAAG